MAVKSIKAPEMNEMNKMLALAWVVHNEDLFRERVAELQEEEAKANALMDSARATLKQADDRIAFAEGRAAAIEREATERAEQILESARRDAATIVQGAKIDANGYKSEAEDKIVAKQKELDGFWDNFYKREHALQLTMQEVDKREAALVSKEKELEWALKKADEVRQMYEKRLTAILEASKS